jgi:hypothetical protein
MDDDNNKMPKPDFGKMDAEDDEHLPSRRIGGPSTPVMFGQMPSTSDATTSQFVPSPSFKSTIDTAPVKASVDAAAPVAVAPGAWMLTTTPPTLPELYPLERTAVFVPKCADASAALSCRISNVLRERSIEAAYDNDKAKITCATADGVDFRVRLYRGRGEFAHGIIVEVQRRFGTSASFYDHTMAILNAAENKPSTMTTLVPNTSADALALVSDAEDDYTFDSSSSFQMVSNMLKGGYDSQYLAYQTLIPLTDASKMGLKTARAVSEQLLQPGNQVGTKVLALVLSNKAADEAQEDCFKLRLLAMTVLANAIHLVQGKIHMLLREELRPTLLAALENAHANARFAQLACDCLEPLLADDHDAGAFYDALETAREAGTARHAGLQRQAEVCLATYA